MATYKTISSADIKTTKSVLNQLVDFIEEDISGSTTRKTYQVFVTGTNSDTGVTSSLYNTIFDQSHTLQTANELFDMTVGLFSGSNTVASANTGTDINGKLLFTSQSLMMREKVNIYRQYAQLLLGNANSQFYGPFGSTTAANAIDEALFINFKRLFVRDGIKRGSSANVERSQTGGSVGNLVNSSNTTETGGLLFYQQGIVILDLAKVTSGSQKMSGSIAAVGNSNNSIIMGRPAQGNPDAAFIPDFLVSGSIDEIVKHIAGVRFGSGSQTCLTFQNNTQINSTLIFCRATADEFNYSSNPTYTDSEGRLLVIDESEQGIQKSFSFITTVGLYDANEELLAVAKLSRPVEKNDEKDLTMRVRLDF